MYTDQSRVFVHPLSSLFSWCALVRRETYFFFPLSHQPKERERERERERESKKVWDERACGIPKIRLILLCSVVRYILLAREAENMK